MSIQDLGSIGELVAAIATLATLVYLALQIKQNTSSVNSNSIHAKEAKQIFSTPGGGYFRTLAFSYGDLFPYLDGLPEEANAVFSEELWPRQKDGNDA